MANIPTEVQHELRLLKEQNAKLKQALKEAKSMLITKGYTDKSIGMGGINMLIQEVAL